MPSDAAGAIGENVLEPAVPDFQRHVSPLLSRMGCNNRNCHGSFQGQGGFQLSLFGYDFAADHRALLGGGRVDLDDPAASLILTKPTGMDEHGGGTIFSADSWQSRLLTNWIAQGARKAEQIARLIDLEVSPSELDFAELGQRIDLRVVAHWEDGTREDVTCWARFQANDQAVCTVDDSGRVTSAGYGDTHVVVFYDNGVKAVPVFQPYPRERWASTAATEPSALESAESAIDRIIQRKLDRLHLRRSPLVDDATFLRRVSLDIAGTLPSPQQIREFLSDQDPGKRARKIDELLATPAYVNWQTTFLCDITGNNSQELGGNNSPLASQQWFDWIRHRVAKQMPYDQIVRGIVLSQSREPGESYYDYCAAYSEMVRSGDTANFVARSTMPYYWMRNDNQDKDARAIAFAQNFLGLQIQCAECHKHPFDRWTQEDFQQFSRFFAGIEVQRGAGALAEDKADLQRILADLNLAGRKFDNQAQKMARESIKEGGVMPFPFLQITKPRLSREERQAAAQGSKKRGNLFYTEATILGGLRVSLRGVDDARQPLMDWVAAADNPYFARVYVNRVWARYFGRGLVNPLDDFNAANPASHPELLDYLAEGFVASGYDMQWVHREIANSRTYQTDWRPNPTNAEDERNFSRAVPRRLPAELVVDGVAQACASDRDHARYLWEVADRAISVPGTTYGKAARGNRNNAFALTAFGRSTRSNNCDCDRSNETSLIQATYLQNDRDVHQWINHAEGWVSEAARAFPDPRELAELQNRLGKEREQLDRLVSRREKLTKAGREVPADLMQRLDKVRQSVAAIEARLESLSQPAEKSLDDLIVDAYLRSLSRFPTSSELDRCRRFIMESKTVREGLAGVLWTLINTKEFVVNH